MTNNPNHRFDLDLFLKLNKEYESKPIVPRPRQHGTGARLAEAEKRARRLDTLIGVRGERVLEVGCGQGALCYVLARDYDCNVIGVDITEGKSWPEYRDQDGLELRLLDISQDDCSELGVFSRIVSWTVWEHIRHPFAALESAKRLLNDDGKFYLYANLYRGPQASHRYREVYFPWPHLLFTDEVFEAFYRHIGMKERRPAWVNKLTYAQYKHYFELLDFQVERHWFASMPLDTDFYNRFEDVLSRYPKSDLMHDFLHTILVKSLN